MLSRTLRIPLLSILLLVTGTLSLSSGAARDIGSFDGRWEGKLNVVDTKGSLSYNRTNAAYDKSPFAIVIHGQRANVYFGETEVKPTSFQTQIYMTNAVVFATDTGNQNGHQWVETWNFSLTQKDSETLIVCLSRVVNNLDIANGEDNSKFYVLAVGEFRQTSH
jgi:hypothetical protein